VCGIILAQKSIDGEFHKERGWAEGRREAQLPSNACTIQAGNFQRMEEDTGHIHRLPVRANIHCVIASAFAACRSPHYVR
jgi:hypothetical protein